MGELEIIDEQITHEVITLLSEKRKITFADAKNIFYNSKTFEDLKNPDTKLYFQSPLYVFCVLEQELEKTFPVNSSISHFRLTRQKQ